MIRHVLQTPLSSFIGREKELDRLKGLVADRRLVTITGPHGVGKTRLALEFAEKARRSYGKHVFVLTDVPVITPELRAVAEQSPSAPRLVILDGHVDAREAPAILAILEEHRNLHIVVVSTRRLGVPGEWVFALGPLNVPDSLAVSRGRVDLMVESDAVALFKERAAECGRVIDPSPSNVLLLVDIVRAVGGIPSAVESVARASAAASLSEIATVLRSERSGLSQITRGAQICREPQEIDSLFSGLGDRERSIWMSAALFHGSFDYTSLRAIFGDSLAVGDVLELKERSIFVSGEDSRRPTDLLLVRSYREVGLRHLEEAGRGEEVADAYRAFILRVLDDAGTRWYSPRQDEWIHNLNRHRTDVFDVLEDMVDDEAQATDALRLIAKLRFYWLLSGVIDRARDWVARATVATSDPAALAVGAISDAYFAVLANDLPAAEAGLRTAREFPQAYRDEVLECMVDGIILLSQKDTAAAHERHLRALALAEARADRSQLGEHYFFVALSFMLKGDLEEADRICRVSEANSQEVGERHGAARTRWLRALIAVRRGEDEKAVRFLEDSLRVFDEFQDENGTGVAVDALVAVAIKRGEYEKAAQLLGGNVGRPLLAHLGVPDVAVDRADVLRRALGRAAFDRRFGTGVDVAPSHAAKYVLEPMDDHRVTSDSDLSANSGLSARELEIAELVSQGLGNPEIAARLYISRRTVEGHIQRILSKLGYRSRSQVAVWFERSRIDSTVSRSTS